MGKVKLQRRSVRARLNPTSVVQPTGDVSAVNADNAETRQAAVLPVIKKMSSPDENERAWACASAANLIGQDHRTRKLLLSNGLIDQLVVRLTDPVLTVAAEAAGTLRNLTVVGGYAACNEMFNKQVLTAMPRLTKLCYTTATNALAGVKPSGNKEDDETALHHRLVWPLAENLLCLYWSLAETSSRILKSVSNQDTFQFVLRFLADASIIPAATAIIAAQCLYTLTENNRGATRYFRSTPEAVTHLLQLVTVAWPEDRQALGVLMAGVLRNIRRTLPRTQPDQDPTAALNLNIAPVLMSYLDWDIQAATEQLAAVAPQYLEKQRAQTGLHDRSELPEEERQLNSLEDRLATMQLCLEILANMASEDAMDDVDPDAATDGDGWEDIEKQEGEAEKEQEDEEDAEDDNDQRHLDEAEQLAETYNEEEGDVEEDAMMDEDSNVHALEDAEQRVGAMLNRESGQFFADRLLPLLVRLAEPRATADGQVLAFAYGRHELPAVAELSVVHARALACLNNYLVLAAERPSRGWFADRRSDAQQCWTWLTEQVAARAQPTAVPDQSMDTASVDQHAVQTAQEKAEARLEVFESALACLWSISRGLAGDVPATETQIRALLEIANGQSQASDSLRAKCIGVLSGVAQRRPGHIEANRIIGTLLMTLITSLPTTPPETTVEALNAIYDVYDDAAHDYDAPVFVAGGFLAALKNSMPAVRQLTRAIDRRQMPGLRERADETLVNLRAFIDYKTNEANQS